jgi:NAD(P)-dependent dehydrogenase (short-subunit alcohol dehydrogenase family)
MNELEGKVVVVTGASTPHGIGNAIAKRFAKAGASLFLVADQTAEQLDRAVRECRELNSAARVESALLDLGNPGEPEAMIAQAHRIFGRVDALINNAAIRAPYDFGEFSRETFDQVIAVNIAAAFFASQAVVPLMRRQGGGRIIHIASQMGQVTSAKLALYGMTKAALIHLTKSMANELCKDNIVVNSLSPGPIATQPLVDRGLVPAASPRGDASDADNNGSSPPPVWNADKIGKLPIGRLGTADEVAEVAFYLTACSPTFLMGQDIVVDGGYLIQ